MTEPGARNLPARLRSSGDARPTTVRPVAPLAPRWHTGALITLLLAVGVCGPLLSASAPRARTDASPLVWVYLPLLLVQLGLLGYVARVGQSRSALGTLLGPVPRTAARVLLAFVLAVIGLAVIIGIESCFQIGGRAGRTATVERLLPIYSLGVMLLTACVVAFCEEVVYRGYLQRQLGAITGRRWLALLLQAGLFGLAHGEQGAAFALRAGVYGLVLAGVALIAGSLYPAILCHAVIDVVAAFAARSR